MMCSSMRKIAEEKKRKKKEEQRRVRKKPRGIRIQRRQPGIALPLSQSISRSPQRDCARGSAPVVSALDWDL